MTDEDLIKRLLLSRRTMEKYRRYPGKQWQGGPEGELAIVETEIACLRDLQARHPERHEQIGGIIDGWQDAKGKIRAKMH